MHNHSENPYEPIPMHIARAYYESNDHSLKTLELVFDRPVDRDHFFASYNPGNSASCQFLAKVKHRLVLLQQPGKAILCVSPYRKWEPSRKPRTG